MRGWAALSLLAHAGIWLALIFGPRLVGRVIPPPLEPAAIEVVIGDGGAVEPVIPGKDGRPAPEAPPPVEDEPTAPLPAPLPEPDDTAPPVLLPVPPPLTPAPASGGGPATVRLGNPGGPPHADLLDPENNRFRAARQDSGNRMPAYPREAALRFEAGTVKLQLFIDPAGRVVNVLVRSSSGSASLDRAAREQALTWKFSPARRDGRAVSDIAEIEIEFRLM